MKPDRRQIRYLCNLELGGTLKLWERIILFFRPLLVIDGPVATVWYKVFLDRLYIYRTKRKQGQLHPVVIPVDGGMKTPWLN